MLEQDPNFVASLLPPRSLRIYVETMGSVLAAQSSLSSARHGLGIILGESCSKLLFTRPSSVKQGEGNGNVRRWERGNVIRVWGLGFGENGAQARVDSFSAQPPSSAALSNSRSPSTARRPKSPTNLARWWPPRRPRRLRNPSTTG